MELDKIEKPVMFYAHDPMCSWCWGFAPAWQLLKKSVIHKYGANLQVQELLGGLAPDSDDPMPLTMRQYLRDTWLEIKQRIPGTEFNFDFWTVCEPKRSTWPACRAVISARRQGTTRAEAEFKQEAMTRAIQKAYYLDARNPSSNITLIAIAEEIGLDKARFTKDLQSEEVRAIHQQEMVLVRQLGVQGFPSIVVVINEVAHRVLLDYSGLQKTLDHIDRLMKSAKQEKDSAPASDGSGESNSSADASSQDIQNAPAGDNSETAAAEKVAKVAKAANG